MCLKTKKPARLILAGFFYFFVLKAVFMINHKSLGLLALILMAMGITYFNFEIIWDHQNIKPAITLLIGAIAFGISLQLRFKK